MRHRLATRVGVYAISSSLLRKHAEAFVFETTEVCRRRGQRMFSQLAMVADPTSAVSVSGIDCTPVTIELPVVGPITILEATAESQERLVDLALLLEEEKATSQIDQHSLSLPTGDPYGAVLWPASSAIARQILENPETFLKNKIVVEVGAGTGLVSIAAATSGYPRAVIATDYETIPLELLHFAAATLNQNCNNEIIQTAHFDLCDMRSQSLKSLVSTSLDAFPGTSTKDVVLVAADIMYEPKTGRAMARRVVEALQLGMHVIIGDSPGRAGRPAFLQELRKSIPGIDFVNVTGTTVTGKRHDLICGSNSPSVSAIPKPLPVAILALDPDVHKASATSPVKLI